MINKQRDDGIRPLLALRGHAFVDGYKDESLAFWMISLYLLFEYVRPQSIIPAIDILPWMQVFIVCAAIGMLFQRERKLASGGLLIGLLVLFFVIIVLSGITAFSPSQVWGNLDRYYLWVIIVFVLTRIAVTERQLFFLLAIFFVASFKLSFFGARTWLLRGFSFTSWGMKGPPGFFENSGELAIQMVIYFGLSVYIMKAILPLVSGWRKWLVIAAPLTAAMTVLASSSRGGQLALAVQLYIIYLHRRVSLRGILVAAAIGGATYWLLPDEQITRFFEMGDDETSIQRMLYWENGWEMMKQHPLLGVGYYNFPLYFEAYYPEDILVGGVELPHNIFIQVGADLGFTGIAVYLALIGLGFSIPRRAVKLLVESGNRDDWRIYVAKGLMLGFLGFLIAGQFVSVVYYPFMWIHLAFCIVLTSSIKNTLATR